MNNKIKPVWKDYKNWEDYKNGMYESTVNKENITKCINILTSENLKENMIKATKEYTISAKVNLTNKMFNPISWLGQVTCNLIIGATARETCQAWMKITKEQQIKANNIAKEVINEWRKEYESIQ